MNEVSLLNSLQQEDGTDYYNMSIKEKGTVQQYFRPSFICHKEICFLFIFEWPFYTGFTVLKRIC